MTKPASRTAGWFLGFDCATKTFAFSLARFDIDPDPECRNALLARLRQRAAAASVLIKRGAAIKRGDAATAFALLTAATKAVAALEADTRFITVVDGAFADLVPGKRDREISTVERIRAVDAYVTTRVLPSLRKHVPTGEKLKVAVEYQMGPNAPARTVMITLVAMFADEDVFLIGPSLKQRISTCEEGRFAHFAERYAKAYDANKEHAKFNFARVEFVFGSGVHPCPAVERGHIADSCLGPLGFLLHGDDGDAAARF